MEQGGKFGQIPEGGTGVCPWESKIVTCSACGSSNFGVDPYNRRGRSIPGRCDDCGGTRGVLVKPSALNQVVVGVANILRRQSG